MSSFDTVLYTLLGSRTRADLIAWFVMHPGESFYIRQLADLLHQSPTPVIRELDKLEKMGLVTSERKAHAKYFLVNTASPLFPELQSLVLKTVGAAGLLKQSFRSFSSLVFVFIHGSFATQEAGPKSDIDLFLIGVMDQTELTKVIKKVEMRVGREIQCSLFDPKEFLKKLKENNDFIRQVVKNPKVMIVGGENEFKRFAKTGVR
ncbi:MAG: nucleotidyltransferase domain-containing protein [Deltaproteobacteria bacterium]|nr:nucleotidyltransferase domain-containing protein [Deltaproteobacteria bacterium]